MQKWSEPTIFVLVLTFYLVPLLVGFLLGRQKLVSIARLSELG